MSTKSTLASGEGWRLYEEHTDESCWLEVRGGAFRSTQAGVVVELPPEFLGACAARAEHYRSALKWLYGVNLRDDPEIPDRAYRLIRQALAHETLDA